MRFSLPQHLYVGFGLPLIALGLVGWFSYQSTVQSVETSARREQTFAVLYELNATLSLFKDAETGQRGYLITGEDRCLDPYRTAVLEIGPTLQHVRGLLSEDDQRPRLTALETLTTDKLDELKETLAERRAVVTVGALPVVWGDPTALEQLFANLIGNALNYLAPDRPGQVEVGASHSPESAGPDRERIYFVNDNGLGVPEAYRAKLFRAFQRFHPNRSPGEGLGLAVVHRVVERHHRRIWIESTVGGGSTFFVALPGARRDLKTTRPTDWAVRPGGPKP